MTSKPVRPLPINEVYEAVEFQACSVIEVINNLYLSAAKLNGKVHHQVVSEEIADCIKKLFTDAGYLDVSVDAVIDYRTDEYEPKGFKYEYEGYYEWSVKLPKPQ